MDTLILSSAADPHALAVADQLEQLGTPYKICHFSEFPTKGSFSVLYPNAENGSAFRLADGSTIDPFQLGSVWFRRPGGPTSGAMPAPWIERMVETECRSALGGIFRSLNCLYVNHPGRDSEAMFKLHQLSQASRVALHVPETLVTNEPERALEFYEKHSGMVVYKLIGESANFCFPLFEIPAGIPTLPFRKEDVAHLQQVRLAPHLFQQRIDKVADIRATVVGEKIFAARIDSQAGNSKLDWRLDYDVPMTAIELPDDVTRGTLQLMRLMELNYAAFDFCLQKDGRYVFLELNCGGQYMWLEQRLGMPISRELALLLSGRSAPIVPAMASANHGPA